MEAEIREYLETLIPASEAIERMTAGTGADLVHPNRGWTYDSELGFVHAQSIHRGDGVNGTSTFYDYEADGARRLVHCADRPCRIHTYGNCFTHSCERFGLPMPSSASDHVETAIDDVFTQAALFSTRPVVELVEQFCKAEGIVLMLILSYCQPTIRTVLDGGNRFDEGFVDWLKRRSHSVVDMCDTFNREFKQSKVDLDDFVKRYYIGHHTPFGNAYTGWTVMEVLVDLLDPKPLPYQSGVGN